MSKKKDIVHKDLLIRVLEYCYPKGEFTIPQIKNDLNLSDEEINYLNKYKSSSSGTKQLFEFTEVKSSNNGEKQRQVQGQRLTPNAIFNYLEYVELVQAKKNARQSFKVAIVAILISVLAILIPILIQLYLRFFDITN